MRRLKGLIINATHWDLTGQIRDVQCENVQGSEPGMVMIRKPHLLG